MLASLRDDAAPLVILLHGATLNGRMWDPVRRKLSPAYRSVAPDLPGHGARRAEPFTLEGAVQTVREAVAAVPVVLVGDSLGGHVAQAAAPTLPPERLRGLVLGGASANLMGRHLVPYFARIALFRVLVAAFGEPRIIRALLPKQLRKFGMSAEDSRALLDAGIHLGAFEQAVNELRKVDFRRNLAAIPQPTFFINGDSDRGMVAQEASFLAAARQPRSKRFANCEHGVSLWRVAEFAALVNAFSDEVYAQPTSAGR